MGDSGADHSDLHHMRPADWNVNAARGNKFYGVCGLGDDTSTSCTRPAHREAAVDTEADKYAFLPPQDQRGNLARSLFYMALRYDGEDDPSGIDLELTDCPESDSSQKHLMGYLSQLLVWHIADPVDAQEIERNNGVCSRYQGNRNPFVDFPDLVSTFFGSPENPGTNGYTCSDTGNNNQNECQGLQAGDLFVTAFNTDNPDEVSLVAINDLPAGATIFMTDNAWTGTHFKSNEGTVKVSDTNYRSISFLTNRVSKTTYIYDCDAIIDH